MDSLIRAAARALAVGDPLGALKRIALREDPPALALRGTALAQLGDLVRARSLLRQAARAFGHREPLSRARCLVAEAEIALACRDLRRGSRSLSAARSILEERGDRVNAAHARILEVRWLLLVGRVQEAERLLGRLDPEFLPPASRVAHELALAGIAVRRVQAAAARSALARAAEAARASGIPGLQAEVEAASLVLDTPAARLIAPGTERALTLAEAESLLSSRALIVDGCRFCIREGDRTVELARRPVLFTLARLLAEAWPADVSRKDLLARAFRAKRVDESYRARLRVEVGRLRKAIRDLAEVAATPHGYMIVPRRGRDVIVLARPADEEHAAVLALLGDGESWSSSGLALALGASARTVQRALEGLAKAGKVQAVGRGRARRWMTPLLPGFTTALLLPRFPAERLG